MNQYNRIYEITDQFGNRTFTDSLNKFAKQVRIPYGQLYSALHKGTRTPKGHYKVKWTNKQQKETNSMDQTNSNVKYKITDPDGKGHLVNSYVDFANQLGLNRWGFYKVLSGQQKSCYGGYNIEEVGGQIQPPKQKSSIADDVLQGLDNSLKLLDISEQDNIHKVKFVCPETNKTCNRKAEIKRVDNLQGLRCDFTKCNIPRGELYFEITRNHHPNIIRLSAEEAKKLGWEFKMDLTKPKVVETVVTKETVKTIPVNDLDTLELELQEKMKLVNKEIKQAKLRLSELNTIKENIGRSLSQTKVSISALKRLQEII